MVHSWIEAAIGDDLHRCSTGQLLHRHPKMFGMPSIPLCVPFARKSEASKAGARWNKTSQVWTCSSKHLSTSAFLQLRPFVPRMYRPDRRPPYIRPWLVPQTLWGKNLRAVLQKEQWDVVRVHAYRASGHRCLVCGGRGPKWPVEADEAWEYADGNLVQTLKGVIALCPDCHCIRHWGKTTSDGREEEAIARLMTVNRWSRAEVEAEVASAFAKWEERSRHEWTSDYSWVTRVHGFVPSAEGEQRAIDANVALSDSSSPGVRPEKSLWRRYVDQEI
jgi:hypothetical protein